MAISHHGRVHVARTTDELDERSSVEVLHPYVVEVEEVPPAGDLAVFIKQQPWVDLKIRWTDAEEFDSPQKYAEILGLDLLAVDEFIRVLTAAKALLVRHDDNVDDEPKIGDRQMCWHCELEIEYHGVEDAQAVWLDRGGNRTDGVPAHVHSPLKSAGVV